MYLLYLTTTMCQPLQHLLCQMAVGLNRQMDFQQHWCLHQQLQLHPEAFDALSGERSTKTTEMMQNFAHSQRSIIAHRTTRKNCDLVRKGCGHENTSTGEIIEMITIPSTKNLNLFTRPIRMVQVTQYPKWANACCMNSEKQKLKIMIYQFGITYWH